MDDVIRIILYILALGVSVIFHEQMHARTAWWLGDPTGKNDNRLSWNPLVHVDPFMTILLPLMLYIGSGGRFLFGGARPVHINPLNFRNPSLGMCLSAVAGPLSNFFLAAVGFGILAIFYHIPFTRDFIVNANGLTYNGIFFGFFFFLNLLLGTFNILPLPGLDGSRVLRYFLPRPLQALMDSIEPVALILTMILVMLGAAYILWPVHVIAFLAIHVGFGPEFAEILRQGLGWA
ncbi:MAG: site-2 protease family protein [Planctomycetes bacterium]|nr:site-2 protease family protein [Planctomycetota bacterium]